jgi:hypothetical protein
MIKLIEKLNDTVKCEFNEVVLVTKIYSLQWNLVALKCDKNCYDSYMLQASLGGSVVLQIFIALKNPTSLAGFEPMNRGSNGKHGNY